ncbi:heparan-alpha-glucosaminide N-acetyltransferase domain-containing protein [uncultured Oxalicibacterium sp.]|uniref:DUF1624 domain-containing protein n=1 Tax=uncultured Oxalicibacterium sp. TaxID=1168540 RepID=UPI0025FEAE3B|nr:heparan-alpha-glucosaminide N-acetyltransferase domain-containing protein [uncultured Oxalicibacterium sp.]
MPTSSVARSAPSPSTRIASIDALRGLVILLMLVDHTREFFFLRAQVGDPMDLSTTEPALFFTRLTSHLCAPIFVALTGLAAYIYADRKGSTREASAFLFKRGLFLIILEWTVINFAWTFDLTPKLFYLQVIWAIGLSMIALSLLLHLPRRWLIALAILIMLGHNLLDAISFEKSEWGYTVWSILHDRGYLSLPWLPWDAQARTSYPLLPWIGVIMIGYGIGPWFARNRPAQQRFYRLVTSGAICIGLFLVLRGANGYGETQPWQAGDTFMLSLMSFFNLTKYPPSADFLLLTLGVGALLLAALERLPGTASQWLLAFGAAPLFFYILHLYFLHALNRMIGATLTNDSGLISVPNVPSVWLLAIIIAIPCWFACRWFARYKQTHKKWWVSYL